MSSCAGGREVPAVPAVGVAGWAPTDARGEGLPASHPPAPQLRHRLRGSCGLLIKTLSTSDILGL